VNSDEIWLLQLWSGTIGAFVAAVMGGLVALLVVRLTTNHQERLAREQLEAQRYETSRRAENALIADLIVAAQDMLNALPDRDGLELARRRMAAGIVAWKLEASNKDLFTVLPAWPHRLLNAGQMSVDSDIQEERIEFHRKLRERVGIFCKALEAWPAADATRRAEIIESLRLPESGLVMVKADPRSMNRP
jgi:hypothetical protein